jgi:hypothetical protein
MSKQEAQKEAIRLAIAKLADIDIISRAKELMLISDAKMEIGLRVFGQDMVLDENLKLTNKETGKSARPDETILLMHYLTNEFSVKPTGDLISFRDMPGGQFYLGPFQSRSVKPLVGRIKNDIHLLKKNLDRFDWKETDLGDFSAIVDVFGPVKATLIYHLGDEEFPANAELLFDSSIKHLFVTEDVAVIAGRICIGLL